MKYQYERGITIVEILISIAIIGIVVMVVLPQFSKMRQNQVLKNTVDQILSSVNQARLETLSSLDSSSYGVQLEANSVIIFKGVNYSSGDPDNRTVSITAPASITNVTLNGTSGTSGEFYFSRLSGTPSKTGTVTVTVASFSKVITISAVGFASVD